MVAAVATLPGLGIGTLWDNSETAYGEVAREILIYGDPIVLHHNGLPWFIQPPLYFWIAAAFARIFGVNEFAMRLPSALATIAMAGAVGYVVARLANPRAALLASVVLSTSLMQAIVGRLAIMDALLDLSVAISVLSWFAALRTGGRRWWYLGWVALALGALAKGPVAPLITALVIVAWALWEQRAGRRIVIPGLQHWMLGLALFVAIAAPWAVALYHAAGAAAFGELLGHYTVGRYLGTIENQSGPIWYYLPVLILGTFPWFAFLVPGTLAAFKSARDSNDGSLARLALAWAIVPLLFFSFAQTKLPNYIALELPALAILIALWFDSIAERDDRRSALAWTAVVPVTIVGLAIAIWIFSHDNALTLDVLALRGAMIGMGLAILVGSAGCFVLLLQRRTAWLGAFALGATSLAALLIVAVVAEPQAERFKPIPPLAAVIREMRVDGDVVAIRGVSGGNALLFYTRPPIAIVDSPGLDATICSSKRVFVVASRKTPPASANGRTRRTLAVAEKDVLYLFDGPPCAASVR